MGPLGATVYHHSETTHQYYGVHLAHKEPANDLTLKCNVGNLSLVGSGLRRCELRWSTNWSDILRISSSSQTWFCPSPLPGYQEPFAVVIGQAIGVKRYSLAFLDGPDAVSGIGTMRSLFPFMQTVPSRPVCFLSHLARIFLPLRNFLLQGGRNCSFDSTAIAEPHSCSRYFLCSATCISLCLFNYGHRFAGMRSIDSCPLVGAASNCSCVAYANSTVPWAGWRFGFGPRFLTPGAAFSRLHKRPTWQTPSPSSSPEKCLWISLSLFFEISSLFMTAS